MAPALSRRLGSVVVDAGGDACLAPGGDARLVLGGDACLALGGDARLLLAGMLAGVCEGRSALTGDSGGDEGEETRLDKGECVAFVEVDCGDGLRTRQERGVNTARCGTRQERASV